MINEQLDFTDRVAIVTGGGGGTGHATALQLTRLGATTVIASRGAEEQQPAVSGGAHRRQG